MLPLGIFIKGNMLRAAAQSCTMYGTASDPLTAQQFKDLRTTFARALWRSNYMASAITSLLVTNRGALDPAVGMTEKIVVSWKKQLLGGRIPDHPIWQKPVSKAHQHMGPIHLYRKTMESIGWLALDPGKVVLPDGQIKEADHWDEFVQEAVDAARQREWTRAAKTRPRYKSVEKGVDEDTTTRLLEKLKEKDLPQGRNTYHHPLGWGLDT